MIKIINDCIPQQCVGQRMLNMEMPGRRKREDIEEGHAECVMLM